MPDELQAHDFEPHVGTPFRIEFVDHDPLELVLSEVIIHPSQAETGQRTPFSLMFHGPLEFGLPQRMYPLQHPALGVLEIFIVPLGPDGRGMQYQAVFT